MTLAEFANVFIPLMVFLLMICLGMELAINDFRRVITYPKAVAVGISGQMLLMPAMAFAVAALWPGSLEFQVGLILLAACPGGPLSNSFVYVARARVDLSVSLTAINGMLALISTPLIANLGIRLFAGDDTDIELPVLKTMAQIFALAILPVIIGMTLKARIAQIFDGSRQIAHLPVKHLVAAPRYRLKGTPDADYKQRQRLSLS